MIAQLAPSILLFAALAAEPPAAEPGILARYTFDEGTGAVVKDRSGNGYDGAVRHADWVPSARGHGLAFKDADSCVDCGLALARRLTADMTMLAWVKLNASPYPDAATNWTLLDCEDYTRSGFIVRVDGQATKFYYRASCAGRVPDFFSKAKVHNGVYHYLAVTRQGNRVALFIDGLPETSFLADPPAEPITSLKISSPGQPFRGTIDEMAIYSRAFSRDEILAQYKRDAAAYGKDTSWFGTFQIEPFLYLDRGKATVAVDFLGVLPMPAGAKAAVELRSPGKPPVTSVNASAVPESGKQDFSFDLGGLPEGEYEMRAVLRDSKEKTLADKGVRFRYPPARVEVPAPAVKTLPPLPAAPQPLPLTVHIGPDGGITVQAKGESFHLASEFSYPGGGFHALGAAIATQVDNAVPLSRSTGEGVRVREVGSRKTVRTALTPGPSPVQRERGGEVAYVGRYSEDQSAWKVIIEQLGPSTYRVTAVGKHYALSRQIEVEPGRVLVKDTIKNLTAEPIGILVRNHFTPAVGTISEVYAAGYPSGAHLTAKPIKTNPTIFVPCKDKDMGVGLAALDDVFIVQSLATLHGGRATLHSDTFALDKNASYTLEWAVYVTPSGDYYDFINQLRRDEGRNGTVDGGIGFVSRGPADRRSIPTREDIALRNLKYLLIHCLSFSADDPGISIEGIEFLDFPKERKLLKEQFAAIHKAFPDLKIAFHVAHSLYATNRPDQVFADSRVIGADGKQAVYTTNPGSYFSPERRAQGWNWYIYYPTLENSFGRAMLRSVDVMMDEIGADGPFMDGFMWAYGGEHTYDRWDGHTAQIDPKTKTIVRKMGSVLLLSQDALVAFCRKIRDKGGVVIANNSVMTRTIAREKYILHDKECFPGPELHLASTPMALSLPSAIRSEPDVFGDVLDKLRWGNLYIYYEEGRLTYPSVPAQMYPITFEEIHSGYVKGNQRLITMHSGLYGWPGDRQLHFAYRYDSRGVQIAHDFLTTVDSSGVRTQVELGKDQCAVVKKIPVWIESAGPVNVHVNKYDATGCELAARGKGPLTLTIRTGDFPIRAAVKYVARKSGATAVPTVAAGESLSFSLELADETAISIEEYAGPSVRKQ